MTARELVEIGHGNQGGPYPWLVRDDTPVRNTHVMISTLATPLRASGVPRVIILMELPLGPGLSAPLP